MNALTIPIIIRYIIEGIAVALVAYFIPKTKLNRIELAAIALTSSATMAVLDTVTIQNGTGSKPKDGGIIV